MVFFASPHDEFLKAVFVGGVVGVGVDFFLHPNLSLRILYSRSFSSKPHNLMSTVLRV